MTRLNRDFFARDTIIVAKELLGKLFCTKSDDGRIIKVKIVETEAYTQDDEACHAYKGKTQRCASLFESPGTLYVYFTYGMHYCANTVTDKKGYGSGVLLRAGEPLGVNVDTKGPAKLCKAFSIDRKFDGLDLTEKDSMLWFEDMPLLAENLIGVSGRVGIKKAVELERRFFIKNNKWVSKKSS